MLIRFERIVKFNEEENREREYVLMLEILSRVHFWMEANGTPEDYMINTRYKY